MRPIRLAVPVASTLLAALFLVPTALAGTAAAEAAAQVSFGLAANVATGDGPASVAVGDFNGDGNPDLAVANELARTVSVLLGSAGGSFTRQTPDLAVGDFPVSVAVGDFNGDQDPDLAVANGFSGTVSVLLGGNGAASPGRPDSPSGALPGRWRSGTSTATATRTSRSPTRRPTTSRCCLAVPGAVSPADARPGRRPRPHVGGGGRLQRRPGSRPGGRRPV